MSNGLEWPYCCALHFREDRLNLAIKGTPCSNLEWTGQEIPERRMPVIEIKIPPASYPMCCEFHHSQQLKDEPLPDADCCSPRFNHSWSLTERLPSRVFRTEVSVLPDPVPKEIYCVCPVPTPFRDLYGNVKYCSYCARLLPLTEISALPAPEKTVCGKCSGSGKCPACDGSGEVCEGPRAFECDACEGDGRCPECPS